MNDDMYARIGAQLRAARKRRGINQQDLGTAVGLTRSSIANVEHGRQHIQVHTLVAACHALGLDPADVMTNAVRGTRRPEILPLTARAHLLPLRRQLRSAADALDRLFVEAWEAER